MLLLSPSPLHCALLCSTAQDSEDIRYMVGALKTLGVELVEDWENSRLVVTGCGGSFPGVQRRLIACLPVPRWNGVGTPPQFPCLFSLSSLIECFACLLFCLPARLPAPGSCGRGALPGQRRHRDAAADGGGGRGGAGALCARRRGAHAGAPHPGPRRRAGAGGCSAVRCAGVGRVQDVVRRGTGCL